MKILHSVHPDDFKTYQTDLIRERFLINNLVDINKINCVYTHYDRMIIGAVCPVNKKIELPERLMDGSAIPIQEHFCSRMIP